MAKFRRQPAVLLCDHRSGGTFLSLALDNHPDVFWARDEPLSPRSIFRKASPKPTPVQALRFALRQPLCDVSGCKVTFRQLSTDAWKVLAAMEAKVILLARRNILRGAVSSCIRYLIRQEKVSRSGRPLHTLSDSFHPSPTPLSPQVVLHECKRRVAALSRVRTKLAQHEFSLLVLDYTDVFGYEGMLNATQVLPIAAEWLCQFLSVPVQPLTAPLRRVNGGPLSEIVENWEKVEEAVKNSPYACWLDEEEGWQKDGPGKWIRR